jgi:penicillin amidase
MLAYLQRQIRYTVLAVLLAAVMTAAEATSPALPAALSALVSLPGLHLPAKITREHNGIVHILAAHSHDLWFLQGYVHAQDRLFQMDYSRHLAAGRLAELLGPQVLPTDVQLRTFGLRRVAEAMLHAPVSPRVLAAYEAYAEGVNAWIASHPLPPEYGPLELTTIAPWTVADSYAVERLIQFDLSFDLSDIDRTQALQSYIAAGREQGFDGQALFFVDLFRTAPFDPASTLPDAIAAPGPSTLVSAQGSAVRGTARALPLEAVPALAPAALDLARAYRNQIQGDPYLGPFLDSDRGRGSNIWVIAGQHTTTGQALLASDPHLALATPATWYPIHLRTPHLNLSGVSFPGIPFVIHGTNGHLSWGSTVNPVDVTDVYLEQVVPDEASLSGLSTMYQGQREPISALPEVFRANPLDGVPNNVAVVPSGEGIPPATLLVPRHGPVIRLDPSTGRALSVQWTGASPTREAETFLALDEAQGVEDCLRALDTFAVGSQNFMCTDRQGNVAYRAAGQVPLREDLQAGTVNGLPPYFLRNGTGGNEWLAVQSPQPGPSLPWEILPAEEMPHLTQPPSGWIINANNDPLGLTLDNDALNQDRPGGGILYLGLGYDGLRAGRITQLVRAKLAGGLLSYEDMQAIQADTVMIDAQVFVPYLLSAFDRAQASATPALQALGADPRVAQAVARLRAWDFSTPTGIPEGYDASDSDGRRSTPTPEEVRASVAATIYNVWRGRFVRSVIDDAIPGLPVPPSQTSLAAIRQLLEDFPLRGGVGLSGVDFFAVAGVASARDRRDIRLLQALQEALDRLAGPTYSAAFGGSLELDDYRWGRLHRIVFAHPLGAPFNVPPAGGAFPPPLADLSGIPTDGGFGTVDVSAYDIRQEGVDAFLFAIGPSQRFATEAGGAARAESSLPGGISRVLGSPFYANLLPQWLTNETYPMHPADIRANAGQETYYIPAW